jgi:hypothetical protein
MRSISRTVFPALALSSLLFAPAAWSQGAPWSPATVPTAHSVPPPPPPAAPAADDEESVPMRVRGPRDAEQTFEGPLRPLTPGRVVAQVSLGWLAGAGGGLLGGLASIPAFFSGDDGLGYAMVYASWTLASSATVWVLGRGGRSDGGFVPTLLGGVTGAFVGAALQFWVLHDMRDSSPMILVTGSLSTIGAVVGYGLSASSASELAAEGGLQARVMPTLSPVRDGLVVGASGSF